MTEYRGIICVLIIPGGLRMVDTYCFTQAQKIIWVKHLLDDDYSRVVPGNQLRLLFYKDFILILKSYKSLMLPIKFCLSCK